MTVKKFLMILLFNSVDIHVSTQARIQFSDLITENFYFLYTKTTKKYENVKHF